MADYIISTRIVAEDAVDPATRGAQRKLDEVEKKGLSVGRSITSALGRAFAMLGGGVVIGQGIRGIIALNSELETAKMSMASLFTVTFGVSMADGIRMARTELEGLRQDAAAGVGELSNYLVGYQMLLSPVTAAGGNLQDVRKLTSQALAAGFALRGQQGLELAPLDITQALQQGVNDRITPIAMSALRAAGVSETAFNKMDLAGRMEALTTAFGKFGPAVELMGSTWEAQFSTLKDHVFNLIRAVSGPLFDRWKGQLQEANTWLAANRDRVAEITGRVGTAMTAMWDHVIRQARTYLGLIVAAAMVQQSSALSGALGSHLASGGRGVAGAAAGLGAGLRDPLGLGRIFGGALGELGGSAVGTKGLLPALSTLGGALNTLLGPLLLVAGAFFAAQGAAAEFPELGRLLTEAFAMLKESGVELVGALGGLFEAFTGLTAKGSALNLVGAVFLLFWTSLLNGLTTGVEIITTLVRVFSAFVELVGGLVQAIGLAVRGDFSGAGGALVAAWGRAGDRLAGRQTGEQRGDILGSVAALRERFAAQVAGLKAEGIKGAVQPPAQVNIGQVNVQVKAEVNEDPNSVAVAWDEIMTKINRNRRSALRPA